MIIRVLGGVVGIFFIGISGSMIFMGQSSLLSSLIGIFLGTVFIVYGVSGENGLSKILPGLAKYKFGKRRS